MQDKKHYLYIVAVALALVLCIYFVSLSEMDSVIRFFRGELGDDPNQTRGLFGDSTGAINTLFSSLAFAGVILTIYWQIQESSKNKEEDHRKQFEDVFFRMASNFEQIIAGLRMEVKESPFDFTSLWDTMGSNDPIHISSISDDPMTTSMMTTISDNLTEPISQERKVKAGREVFQSLYEQDTREGVTMRSAIEYSGIDGYEGFMQGELDHYFRYFYRILRYIDDSKLIDDRQKYDYAAILRAHLSIYELLLIHYNGLSEDGWDRLKPLIEKYSMFDNIRDSKLAKGSIEKERKTFGKENYYEDSAFGHQREKSYCKIVALRNKSIWSGLLAVVLTLFALPLWNKTVVNDILCRVPGESLPLLFAILGVVGLYIWLNWKEDAKLVKDIHGLKNPSSVQKEDIEVRVLKRCKVVPYVVVIILVLLITVLFSDYYLTGSLSIAYICVACWPLVYQVMAIIVIRLEVQDAKLIRRVELFEK